MVKVCHLSTGSQPRISGVKTTVDVNDRDCLHNTHVSRKTTVHNELLKIFNIDMRKTHFEEWKNQHPSTYLLFIWLNSITT